MKIAKYIPIALLASVFSLNTNAQTDSTYKTIQLGEIIVTANYTNNKIQTGDVLKDLAKESLGVRPKMIYSTNLTLNNLSDAYCGFFDVINGKKYRLLGDKKSNHGVSSVFKDQMFDPIILSMDFSAASSGTSGEILLKRKQFPNEIKSSLYAGVLDQGILLEDTDMRALFIHNGPPSVLYKLNPDTKNLFPKGGSGELQLRFGDDDNSFEYHGAYSSENTDYNNNNMTSGTGKLLEDKHRNTHIVNYSQKGDINIDFGFAFQDIYGSMQIPAIKHNLPIIYSYYSSITDIDCTIGASKHSGILESRIDFSLHNLEEKVSQLDAPQLRNRTILIGDLENRILIDPVILNISSSVAVTGDITTGSYSASASYMEPKTSFILGAGNRISVDPLTTNNDDLEMITDLQSLGNIHTEQNYVSLSKQLEDIKIEIQYYDKALHNNSMRMRTQGINIGVGNEELSIQYSHAKNVYKNNYHNYPFIPGSSPNTLQLSASQEFGKFKISEDYTFNIDGQMNIIIGTGEYVNNPITSIAKRIDYYYTLINKGSQTLNIEMQYSFPLFDKNITIYGAIINAFSSSRKEKYVLFKQISQKIDANNTLENINNNLETIDIGTIVDLKLKIEL